MSGICDTCQRLKRMGCGLVMNGLKSCDWYEHESRYERLFGTPERAAKTAWRLLMCHITTKCDECPMGDGCDISTDANCDDGETALLEWLRGDV